MDQSDRREHVTRLVTDWALRTAVHHDRLWTAAQQGPEVLERAFLNILRGGGSRESRVKQLRHELSPDDVELVNWVAVAGQLTDRGDR
jgi:hypothetical protein